MFRVSRIECDGREAKRSKDLEAEAGLPGAHVDPVDVVRLVIGAGHIEVARDASLHGASAGVSRAVRCVPRASPRAQRSSKTHQAIFLELEADRLQRTSSPRLPIGVLGARWGRSMEKPIPQLV